MNSSKIILNRNNTNFQLSLFKHLKNAKFDTEYSFLRYHQNLVRYYLETVNAGIRGLLIYHETGTGKSMVIAVIALDIIEKGSKYKVIFMLSKSLHANLKLAIKKCIHMRSKVDPEYNLGKLSDSELDEWIDTHFEFVSLNASNMLAQLNEATIDYKLNSVIDKSLENTAIFIDEAHNLFRSITNGSKNSLDFYEMVMSTKNMRIFFFTGTPINSSPFELVPCFNMLSGSRTTLPEDYSDFSRLFLTENGLIKNKDKFQNRIFGLVSFAGRDSTFGKAVGITEPKNKAEFPKEFPLIVEKINMDIQQYSYFRAAYDTEQNEKSFGQQSATVNMSKPKSAKSSSYKVKTRMISNFCIPCITNDLYKKINLNDIPADKIDSPKFRAIFNNIRKHRNQLSLVYSQFINTAGLGAFARFLIINGYDEYILDNAVTKQTDKFIEEDENIFEKNEKEKNEIKEDEIDEKEENETSEKEEIEEEKIIEGKYEPISISNITFRRMRPSDSKDVNCHNKVIVMHDNKPIALVKLNSNNEEIVPITTTKYGYIINGTHHSYINMDQNVIKKLAKNAYYGSYTIWGGIEAKLTDKSKYGKFAIITGSVDIRDRQRIVDIYSSPENKHGKFIEILLISASGAEGLDLKNVRQIHIMEPYWNYARILQVIARGVRGDSHKDLPPEERNVQPYIYLAIPPEQELRDKIPITTDEELYNSMIKDRLSVESFCTAIREASIECLINEDKNCRVCSPTDRSLFTNNIKLDIESINPCSSHKEEKITAKNIEYEGKQYYYSENPESIYKISIFELDPQINAYRRIRENTDIFQSILRFLQEKMS